MLGLVRVELGLAGGVLRLGFKAEVCTHVRVQLRPGLGVEVGLR